MITAREGIIALVLFLPGMAFCADLDSMKAECDSCHGPLGVSAHPDVPTIAGQTPEFLKKTLEGFQFWDRPCVKTDYKTGDKAGKKTDMCKVASALDYEDIPVLAAWYSEQAWVSATQEFDAAQAEAGKALHEENCERCHAQGGSLGGKGPRLAGQWKQYMISTVKYFPTGERLCPPMMERKVFDLGEEQMTQLLNYYASQQE